MRDANRFPLLARSLALASSAMLLASCGHLKLADLPAPLKVELPTTCEDILTAIELPAFGRDDDAIPAFLAMEAVAIGQAGIIELAHACLVKQREDYAGKGGR